MTELAGVKSDESKDPMSLLPFGVLREVAKVLGHGRKKYGEHNWRLGLHWSRIESAMLRHYERYQSGEDVDPESGLLHTAHLACNALFLLAHQMGGFGSDDRHRRATTGAVEDGD